ncbi:type II secretion system F family protein [Elusimicrobiota bacterium]
MASFAYKAKSATGAITEGVIDADSIRTATNRLKSQRLNIVEIKEGGGGLGEILNKYNPFKPSVSGKDLVIFSRQLATLVAAGVPLVQGLALLTGSIENPLFKSIVEKLKADIEEGSSIYESMRKYPEAFTELYSSMIRAGEMGGVLDVILDRLSSYLEASEELKHKVKGALMYPAVVVTIAVSVTAFLLIVIIPRFEEIFASFGSELPMPTQILLGLSKGLTKYFYMLFIVPFGFYRLLKYGQAHEPWATRIDAVVLKLPIFGDIMRKVAIAKFARTLSTLVKSGVNILEALDTVGKTSGNKVVEHAIEASKKSIQEGQRFSDPLKKSGVFPAMVVQMISIGEESGNLDTMLSKIADFYDGEVDAAVKGLTSMIEPIVICFMGVVVGAIVVAMFLPMFEISSAAGDM